MNARRVLSAGFKSVTLCLIGLLAACTFDATRLRASATRAHDGAAQGDGEDAAAGTGGAGSLGGVGGAGGGDGPAGTGGVDRSDTPLATGIDTASAPDTGAETSIDRVDTPLATGMDVATGPDTGAETSTGQTGGLSVNPDTLNFGNDGFVVCSTSPAPAGALGLTLSNTSAQSFNWTAALGRSPSPFSFAPTSGTLSARGSPGASVTVTVTPRAIPFPADTTSNAYGDLLSITTTIPADSGHLVNLNQTARGAILAFQPSTPYDFGDVQVGTVSSASIQVVNTGNVSTDVVLTAAILTGQSDANFTVNSGAISQLSGVAAGANQTVNIGFTPGGVPADAMPATGTLTMSVGANAVLCAAPPGPLQLTGTGTVASVTITPPSQVFFTGPGMTQNGTAFNAPAQGFTYCGTTAGQQPITFGNTGTTGYTITDATLGQGVTSPYTISIGNNGDGVGVVNPGKAVPLTLISAPVPSNWNFQNPPTTFNDTLTVTTNAVGDSPHVFSIAQSPYGAVLQHFTPAPNGATVAFNFPNAVGGGQSSIPMGLANTGNAPATVSFSVTDNGNAPPGTWYFDKATLAGFSSLPDGVTSFSAYFSPPVTTSNVSYSGGTATFTLTETPLCATVLPVTMATTTGMATSTQPITVTPTSIVFAAIPCGTSAPTGVNSTVTIKNPTAAPVNWTASIPPNPVDNTTFTLSNSSGSIPANNTDTFTISPAPIPAAPDVVAPGNGAEYSNVLTVTVGSTNTFTIPVTEIASGLFLKLPASMTSPHPTSRPPFTSQPFQMQNLGDIGGTVTLTLTNSSPALLALNTQPKPPGTASITSFINPASSAGSASLTDFVINTSASAQQRGTERVTATIPASTPFCWPTPTMSIVGQ